jgi:hypothetical protein
LSGKEGKAWKITQAEPGFFGFYQERFTDQPEMDII